MKTPPLLLGATLVFWGWQTGFFVPAGIMAVLFEGAHLFKTRWEFSDDDFARIWTFCTLLCLAGAIYAFTANQGPADFINLIENPNYFTQRNAGTATGRSAAALFRWLPMILFPFVAAQTYSTREGIPLETISLILRRRWKKARKLGLPAPASRSVQISYPYFGLCLFATSVHSSEDTTFFWGLCLLLAWGLGLLRSRRFRLVTWMLAFGVAIALGYFGQRGLGHLQGYLTNFNAQWLASFSRRGFDPGQSETQLGKIGRLKMSGKIVIRLETRTGAPPPRLREASYDLYRFQTWHAEAANKDFARVNEEALNGNTYVLLPGKTNAAAVNIACYLPGGKALLPLPPGSARLENLVAYNLEKNALGAVLNEGPGLVDFEAFFGPGETIDSPANTNKDLLVPQREVPAIQQVIAGLGLSHPNAEQAVQALSRHFIESFTYSTWQRQGRRQPGQVKEETPLARFLLQTHSGHCEYFATAGVLLLRQLGIPARYAVGYAVHEGSGHKFIIRQRDAHAWCLVWDEGSHTWHDFDPTPAAWVQVETQRASRLQPLSDLWSWIGFQISKFRWGQGQLRQYILWALVPILAFLLYQIIFRRRKRQGRTGLKTNPGPVWPGLDSEFYGLEQKLTERGFTRQPGEPLSAWLQRAAEDPALIDLRGTLQDLLRLHYRYRFDPAGLSADERDELKREAKECLVKMG